jgi:formylglycine-generating enzyme required for sulfatase activity
VTVAFSSDGGASYSITPAPSALSGDLGTVAAGGANKRIVWDAPATLPAGTYNTQFKAAVTATENASAQEITITLPGGVTMVMVKIPAGSFQMGSPDTERGRNSNEGPVHTVTISQAFYMGKTEVTQQQWQAVMGTAMPTSCGSYGAGNTYPVYCVSWNDIAGAGGFIEKLNQYLGTTKFRLPSEAEWEYAARGGTTTPFSFAAADTWDLNCGSFPEALSYMWWCGNNTPYGSKFVGTKAANPFGLYDMHGNLYELCQDWYGAYSSGAQTDPPGPETGSFRVIRGGGWGNLARLCRSADRSYNDPASRNGSIGFRLARSL